MKSSQALYSRRSRREQRKSPPLDIFIRPGRRTPRKPRWALEELKQIEQFNFTEDGVPIRRSEDDLLDEAYAEGVQAGLDAQVDRDEFIAVGSCMERNPDEQPEQAFRRGLQQGAAETFHALQKAQLLDERTLKKLNHFVYWKLFWFSYAKRRQLCRHIVRDRPPRLEINPAQRRCREG